MVWLYNAVMLLKDADGMANSANPVQTASLGASDLSLHLCSDISVPIYKIFMVNLLFSILHLYPFSLCVCVFGWEGCRGGGVLRNIVMI